LGPSGRTFAVEATVFWLLVPAIVLLAIGYQAWVQGGPSYFAGDMVFILLFVIFAYGSWKVTKWGLVGAIGFSLIFAVLRVAFGISVSAVCEGLESAIQNNAVTEIPALLCSFNAYRALRELKVPT